jgi:hypothetical protein
MSAENDKQWEIATMRHKFLCYIILAYLFRIVNVLL